MAKQVILVFLSQLIINNFYYKKSLEISILWNCGVVKLVSFTVRWQSDAVSHFFKWPAIKGKINWKSYWRVLLSRQNQCSQRFWFISIDVFKLLQRSSSCHVWPITRFCGFNLFVFSKWNINFQFRLFWNHHFYYTHTWGNVGSMRRVKTITMPFLLFMRGCRGCES